MMALDSLLPSRQQKASLAEATARYHQNVDSLGSYLAGRGISRDAATSFQLGRVSDPLPGHERFAGMMSMPYLTDGGVLALKFRCLETHDHKAHGHAKYDQPGGQKLHLFNVNALLSNSDTVMIVEGELSAIVGTTVVGVPTVGTPGTQWDKEHPHWPRCFADFERVIVVADHDITDDDTKKGVAHAKRVASTLQQAEVVLPPVGMDLDEWVAAAGVDAVRERCGLV